MPYFFKQMKLLLSFLPFLILGTAKVAEVILNDKNDARIISGNLQIFLHA